MGRKVMRSRYGSRRPSASTCQYDGLRSATSSAFGLHEANRNGPVPIGSVAHVAGAASCLGARIPRRPFDHRKASKATQGTAVLTRTVAASTISTLATSLSTRPNNGPAR